MVQDVLRDIPASEIERFERLCTKEYGGRTLDWDHLKELDDLGFVEIPNSPRVLVPACVRGTAEDKVAYEKDYFARTAQVLPAFLPVDHSTFPCITPTHIHTHFSTRPL